MRSAAMERTGADSVAAPFYAVPPMERLPMLEDAAWASRRDGWEPLPPKYTRGVLGKYAKVVQSAAHGAVCG